MNNMMINRYDMRIKTNYKKCIRTVCIALFSLAFTGSVSYTHLRAHETGRNLVCRLLLEKKKTDSYLVYRLLLEKKKKNITQKKTNKNVYYKQ